jgi:hypothetical protein
MTFRNPADHPYFLLLLVWRAIVAALALHAVVDKPFEAMLMALVVLGLFALIGEFAYARKLHLDNERLRLQADREARERRAEEARQRFAATRAAPEENRRRGFGLDDEPPAIPEPGVTELESLSAEAFDLALAETKPVRRDA